MTRPVLLISFFAGQVSQPADNAAVPSSDTVQKRTEDSKQAAGECQRQCQTDFGGVTELPRRISFTLIICRIEE